MCPFIETLRIENGVIDNLSYHTERFNRTRFTFWNDSVSMNLADYIRPPGADGILKCRIVYDEAVREVTYAPYAIRPVRSLRIVTSNTINYTHKSTDREALNCLFSQRETADEVLIVRNGLLTDTSIANIALYDGVNWFTPATPLLKGTRRAALLDEHTLTEREIPVEQLFDYSYIALFNAMIDFGKILLPVSRETFVI